MTQPLSARLGTAFASSPILYPPLHRRPPRDGPTPRGGRRAYHVPRMDHGWSRLCLSAGGFDSDGRGWERPLHLATYLLVQASQRLWLAGSHDVYRQFTWVSRAIHPGPRPPWRWQSSGPLAGPPATPSGWGYVVPGASHRRVAPAARPGGVPVVAHRVMSRAIGHDRSIRSLVSHLPQTRTCSH